MTSTARLLFTVWLASILVGCGLRIPDPVTYTAACEGLERNIPADAASEVFVVSSALRDCRDGSLTFSGFRSLPETYGIGRYRWAGRNARLRPNLLPLDGRFARQVWLKRLKERVDTDGQGRLIVFIHGYNNSFGDAFKTAAEISQLAAEGVPTVLIHWPSRGKIQGYTFDEATLEWAQGSIDAQLGELSRISDQITLVAHSMGTRAAIRGVLALDRIKGAKPESIRRIVLASGDVDRDEVLRDGGSAELLLQRGRQMLIYASHRDLPIQLSRRAHAYSRLGSTSCRHDVWFEARQRANPYTCHLTKARPGLAVVSTGRVDADGRLEHKDFIKECRTRADFAAFLRGEATFPFRKDVSEGERVGFEIDPDASDPAGLCPPED